MILGIQGARGVDLAFSRNWQIQAEKHTFIQKITNFYR